MGLDKNLVQGSLDMLILKLLEEKDMYGYEMIERLGRKSNNVFELKAGSLYPLLHSLEGKEFVTSYEDEDSGKRRKYYHLTKKGNTYLKNKQKEWNIYSEAVLNVLSIQSCIS